MPRDRRPDFVRLWLASPGRITAKLIVGYQWPSFAVVFAVAFAVAPTVPIRYYRRMQATRRFKSSLDDHHVRRDPQT